MEGTSDIPDYDKSVGYVPYLVNFEYQYYPIDTDKTTPSQVCFQKNPVTQKIENADMLILCAGLNHNVSKN